MSRVCVPGDISLYNSHGIVFASFGEGRYHVYRALWESPDTVFLGTMVKRNDVFYFTPAAPGSMCYVGATRYDIVRRFLTDHVLEED